MMALMVAGRIHIDGATDQTPHTASSSSARHTTKRIPMEDEVESTMATSSLLMHSVTSFEYTCSGDRRVDADLYLNNNNMSDTESTASSNVSEMTLPLPLLQGEDIEDEGDDDDDDIDHAAVIAKILSTKLLQAQEELVAAGLCEIADLCGGSGYHAPEYVKAVVQHGTLLLVHALKQFAESSAVQVAGLRALQHAASSSRDFCKSVWSVGASSVILRAMQNHDHDVLIQTHACAALLSLVVGDKKRVAQFVVDHQGLETVMGALKAFAGCYDLLERGIRLMEAVCRWNEFKPYVISAGGLIALAKAMAEHPERPEMQDMACRTMRNLCKQSKWKCFAKKAVSKRQPSEPA
jgi:hypothetical protein